MEQLIVSFNKENYVAKYNEQTGYFEIDIKAPELGGIYKAEIIYKDFAEQISSEIKDIQILAKEKIHIDTDSVFMWIFNYRDLTIKDILELVDYEILVDEEVNSNSLVKALRNKNVKKKDIVLIQKNNDDIFWGIVDNVQNEFGKSVYTYTLKYITNLFDQKIELKNENLIKTAGIEDFIADAIKNNYIKNEDTFVNLPYLQLEVKTHNVKQTSVSNVQDNIFNLHTWMTNCTQNYDIIYSFKIEEKKLVLTIENKTLERELIDVNAQAVTDYDEVFETSITSKVVVLTKNEGKYILYLKNDRTTTIDMNDPDRAEGETETVYIEKMEDANQKALDVMKANAYNHKITFSILKEEYKIGTPITIKTKESLIYDTYISAIKRTKSKVIEYTCGNIRTKFIEKLLKERKN